MIQKIFSSRYFYGKPSSATSENIRCIDNQSKARDTGRFLAAINSIFVKTMIVILKNHYQERTGNMLLDILSY